VGVLSQLTYPVHIDTDHLPIIYLLISPPSPFHSLTYNKHASLIITCPTTHPHLYLHNQHGNNSRVQRTLLTLQLLTIHMDPTSSITKQPKQPKQKPTSPNFLQSSNSNSNSNIASSPKQPSAVQKKLKQIAHKLGHAWKLHLPPPPASSPTTKSSSQKSTSTSTNKEKAKKIVHALKSAWKLHLPPAPLATPKHEHKHVDEMPLLNASDSRTIAK
jgi:hypothetical protein